MIRYWCKDMETDILLIAKQLIEQGKKPTVATIKGRLPRSVSIPVIIKVLQKVSDMSLAQITALIPQSTVETQAVVAQETNNQHLQQEVERLSNELHQVKNQLEMLTQQFQQHLQQSDET